MNWRIINVIIGREYMNRVKKKSFFLITFLGPIFFALICMAPALIMVLSKEEAKKIAVVDKSQIVYPYLESNKSVAYADYSTYNVDSLKNNLQETGEDVLLYISPLDSVKKTVSVYSYSEKPIGTELQAKVENNINKAIENYRISTYNIDDLSKIMQDVQSNVKISTYLMDDSGNESISSSGVYMAISMILGMIIYMFISMFCGMVMSSVIEEKSSRVVEVLVSSVKATELMFGKIIGIALVAITQFVLWILLTILILGAASPFISISDMMKASTEPANGMVTSMNDANSQLPGAINMDNTIMLSDSTTVVPEETGMAAVVSTLARLDYTTIIIAFILYFILGYLLYASIFAAVGSAVENEADAGQLQIPVTIPLLIGFFIAFYAYKSPDSALAFWGSIIPFTSPIVMLARVPFGVPLWQLVLSIGLLLVTFIVFAWASAKIYKIGILMYGKKASWKDLWKWLKQK